MSIIIKIILSLITISLDFLNIVVYYLFSLIYTNSKFISALPLICYKSKDDKNVTIHDPFILTRILWTKNFKDFYLDFNDVEKMRDKYSWDEK